MRATCKIALTAVFGLLSVGLVVGQPGGGFQFGGGGGGGGDPYTLLKNKQVQKELKVTDDQLEKITTAVDKAVQGALNKDQVARLNQISLQLKGVSAFKDAKIQSKLQLSKAQKDDISALFSDFEKESAKITKDEGFKAFKKIGELRKEMSERVMSVLSSDQKKTYEEITGEKFKLDFGGGKGAGGNKKPKNDT